MSFFEPFRAVLRPSADADPWYFAGNRSSFPDISPDTDSTLSDSITCPPSKDQSADSGFKSLAACKIVKTTTSPSTILDPSDDLAAQSLDKQVLVFQYRGKFHAVDHQCPHNSFPLSRGRVGDIEDFGIVLSAEITCPKHGWAFDLFTGQSDRGSYKLGVWEVEMRQGSNGADDEEVWVRKKVRIRQG